MSNPATELATLLENWKKPGQTTVRKGRRGESGEPWMEVGRAVSCLYRIDRVLEAMEAKGEDIEMFQIARRAWYEAVFVTSQNWDSNVAAEWMPIEAHHLDTLKMFGRIIESGGLSAELSESRVESIISALDEAERIAVDLDHPSARELLWHIRQAQVFARDARDFGARTVLHSALEAASRAYEVAKDDKLDDSTRANLKKVASEILVQAMGSSLGVGLVQLATAAGGAIAALASGIG